MAKSKNPNELTIISIYQNTQTALQSIDNILPSIKDASLSKELKRQTSEYKAIAKECKGLSKKEKFELPDNSFLEKLKLWSSIKMGTLTNKSTRHVTEMLLFGTFMGIIQCIKDSLDYHVNNEEITRLLKQLQEQEESNLEKLKTFL